MAEEATATVSADAETATSALAPPAAEALPAGSEDCSAACSTAVATAAPAADSTENAASPQEEAEHSSETSAATGIDTAEPTGDDTALCTGTETETAPAEPQRPMSWAQRASRHADAARASAKGSGGALPQAAPVVERRSSILDYFLLLANQKAAAATAEVEAQTEAPAEAEAEALEEPHSEAKADVPSEAQKEDAAVAEKIAIGNSVPEELRKFEAVSLDVPNHAKATYSRLGIRNDSNICYASVVFQSLLSCPALLWILRQCSPSDSNRPFCTCLMKLFKEFHVRKGDGVIHALAMPEVKDIITRWQRLGVQQDAGEFLFYLINGMHDECKWKLSDSSANTSEEPAETADAGAVHWLDVVKTSRRRVEERFAGMHEDSPFGRIFGGVMRSIVRAKAAKADSVSLEPFNHISLDISHANVNSVWDALVQHCNPEDVNDGHATRKIQFKMLPHVLVVILKRFVYTSKGKTVGVQKIKKSIEYKPKLTFHRSWLADAAEPLDYAITAVICHHGDSANGGHYTAAVRYSAESGSEWYLYDDTVVRRMEPREVAAQQDKAYLLIYQCHNSVDFRP